MVRSRHHVHSGQGFNTSISGLEVSHAVWVGGRLSRGRVWWGTASVLSAAPVSQCSEAAPGKSVWQPLGRPGERTGLGGVCGRGNLEPGVSDLLSP